MKQPPLLAQKLLKWYAGKADLEDIQGDLNEVYGLNLEESGKLKADFKYWRQALSLLFSYGLKKRKTKAAYSSYYHKNSIAMIRNYFKIALRSFSKHKLFTSLNLFGLALGMSICLLALSISVAIYQSDNWQANRERIFQVNTHIVDQNDDRTFASTFKAMGDHLKEQYPFVEEAVTIQSNFYPEVDHNGNMIPLQGYMTEQSFLDVFSFKLIKGDQKTALSAPNSMILTEEAADLLFRDEEVMGKTLETSHGIYTVTGVMENLKQTHFYFDMLASPSEQRSNVASDWTDHNRNYVYVLLDDTEAEGDLAQALEQTAELAASFNPERKIAFEYIDLEGVVPRWNISRAIGIGWDQPSMIFFLTIGLLVLLPAVFNYTNMSIARALKRAKEIGIRKVVGAEKHQIKAQFIIETIILAVFALVGSLVLLYPMKQEFLSMIIGGSMLNTDPNAAQILTFLIFSILVGVLAGLFPAQFFAKLNPIQTMKGEIKNGKSTVSGFKKGLFVFQFFLSLIFVIGVMAMARQYSYVLNNNHGFQSENILAVPLERIDKQIAINELGSHPDVKAITSSSNLPGLFMDGYKQATSNQQDTIEIREVFIGDDFIESMQIELAWGESQSLQASNQNEELVLVNERFIEALQVFNVQSDTLRFTLADGTKCRIVGIMKDFNYEPLNQIIDPLVMRYSLEDSKYALLTVSSGNIKRTVNELEERWSSIDQEASFRATFLDDEIEDAYWFLRVQMKFFSVLSTLAITISCLGLLGMVSYTTENRTKEIAVRKIMGASNPSLYYLLTKDFIKLILISALIAIPVSYVFYDKLFLHFLIPYGTGLGFMEIFVSVLFLFLVGLFSIYWQTAKVTKANPATKLRYE